MTVLRASAGTCPSCNGTGCEELWTTWGAFFGLAKCSECGGSGVTSPPVVSATNKSP